MPASSSDSITPVEASLRASLGGKDSLDQQLAASSTKVLLQKIDFEPALKSCSFQPESIKAKYVLLNPSKTPSDAFDGKTPKKMNPSKVNGESSSLVRKEPDDGIPPPKVILFPNEVEMQWKAVRKIGAGLHNMGNTCFLNSTLQCLTYTAPLANYLMTDDHPQKCKVTGFCMMCELQRHMRRCFEKPGNAIRPQTILLKLNCIAKHMHWGRQEDAHEFLRYVVDAMQKSSLVGNSKLDRYSKETTVVNKVFGGFLRSQVTCLRCKEKSNTYDPCMDISLDIKNVPNIQKAFEKFVQPETLDCDNAYHCPRCKHKVSATKRFSIHRPPNAMTIQLKRFDYNKSFGGKISRHIHYPDRLDVRPYMSVNHGEPVMYQLYGVLVHSGMGCTSGHYYCYVKSPSQVWHCMNDSSVSQVGANRVFNSEAYLLFYHRLSPKKPHPNHMSQKVVQNGPLLNPAMSKCNGPHSQKSNDMGVPVSRKPTATVTGPTKLIGPQKPPIVPSTIPLPNKRDKVSFGIRPINSTHSSSSQVESQKPRIVMHIKKNGLGYAVENKSEKLVNGIGKKGSGLVPYGEESSDSDLENRSTVVNHKKQEDKNKPLNKHSADSTESEKASSVSVKDKLNVEIPVKNSKSDSALTNSRGPSKDLNRSFAGFDLKHSSLSPTKAALNSAHAFGSLQRSMSDSDLSVKTSLPTKLNSTTPWNVQYKESAISPSIASEESSTSINSTTGEWKVHESVKSAEFGPHPAAGWTVTNNKETLPNGHVSPKVHKTDNQSKKFETKVQVELDQNDTEKPKLKPLILRKDRDEKENEKDPLTLHIFKKNFTKEKVNGDVNHKVPSDVDRSHSDDSEKWTIKQKLLGEEDYDRHKKKHKKHKKHKKETTEVKYEKLDESSDYTHKKRKKKKKKHKRKESEDSSEGVHRQLDKTDDDHRHWDKNDVDYRYHDKNDTDRRHEKDDGHRHHEKNDSAHRLYEKSDKRDHRHHDKKDSDQRTFDKTDGHRHHDKNDVSHKHKYDSEKLHDRNDTDHRRYDRKDPEDRNQERNRDYDYKYHRKEDGDHRHYDRKLSSPEYMSHKKKSDDHFSNDKSRKRSSPDDDYHKFEGKRVKTENRSDGWVKEGHKQHEKEREKSRHDAPAQHWDHHVKDGYKRRHDQHESTKSRSFWDGTKSSGVAEELEKQSSSRGYGASVTSWDGGPNHLDQEVERDRKRDAKRSWQDDYEDELDRGKAKKYKANASKSDPLLGGRQNIFQAMQNYRNETKETFKFDSPPVDRDTNRPYRSHHSHHSHSSDHHRSDHRHSSQSRQHNSHHHHH